MDVVLGGQLWYTQDSLGQVPLFVLSCTLTQKEGGNLKHAQAATRSPDVPYNPLIEDHDLVMSQAGQGIWSRGVCVHGRERVRFRDEDPPPVG